MTKKQGNIYLDALEYGEENLINRHPIERKQLREYLENKGYKFTTKEEERLRKTLQQEAFSMLDGEYSNRKYYLSIGGYFKLLAYRELHDARKFSKIAAVFVALVFTKRKIALGVSIKYSKMELEQETTIDNRQFKVIENIWHYLEPIDSKE